MGKRILREYISAFRWKNLKKIAKYDYASMACSIWLIIYIFWNASMERKSEHEMVIKLAALLPLVFLFLSKGIHPFGLPKIMYLCPMSEKERKQYIFCRYYIQMAIHLSVSVIGIVVLFFVTEFHPLALLGMFSNALLLSSMVGIGENGENHAVQEYFLFPLALFTDFVQFLLLTEANRNWIWQLAFWIIFFCIELPISISYWRYLKKTFEASIYYE